MFMSMLTFSLSPEMHGCLATARLIDEQGWPISRGVVFEPSADNTVYTTFFYVRRLLCLYLGFRV